MFCEIYRNLSAIFFSVSYNIFTIFRNYDSDSLIDSFISPIASHFVAIYVFDFCTFS